MNFELEFNPEPSVATFQPITENSPRSRMSVEELKNIPSNGHTLDSLREFATISRHDQIDRVGIATKLLSESAGRFAKSGLRASLMKAFQTPKKPNV